jgi:cytochrome oxidase Cu insertion factor (SCO1/SenC/PrrC family)
VSVSATQRPKEEVVSPRSNRRHIVIAAIALCAAVGASFLLENQKRQTTFVGLTGSKEDIDRVTGAYGASYAFVHTPGDPPENYNVMHSSNLYLVNPEGQWELIYDFQQLQQSFKIASDVHAILHR